MFFEAINWEDLYNRKITPPFIPVIKSDQSVDYFDKEFTDENPDLTPPDERTCLSLSSPSLLPILPLQVILRHM